MKGFRYETPHNLWWPAMAIDELSSSAQNLACCGGMSIGWQYPQSMILPHVRTYPQSMILPHIRTAGRPGGLVVTLEYCY